FTSNPAIIVDSGIVETPISDHFLVFAALNLRMPKPPAAYVVARSYKYYDSQSFLSDLNKIPWHENILSDDVNEKLLHFNKAFFRVLDNNAPTKKIKIKHRRCPFINEEIKEKMAKRDQAHKIARETGALVDWQYYRDCRNDVKRVLREAEKEYVQNEVKKNQSSSEQWKVIRNCIPTREKSRPAYSRDMKELLFFTEVGVRAAQEAKRFASKNIELLQTVQNFAARIVSGTRKFDHVTPILKQLQWLPIVKQLEVRDATMVFKCLNGLAPPYLCQKFKTRSAVHNCNTRNRDRLHIPLCRTAAGQRAFTFRGQRLWNSLPDEFQSITNLDVF
ncbi:unnamed protein product, partial [Porites evermanni]